MGLSRRTVCLAFLVTLILFDGSPAHAAGAWDIAAAELAAKILARATPPAIVALEVKNQSSLSARETSEIAQGLRTALRARGARLVSNTRPKALVVVTLSENLQGWVWVAEITRASLPENPPEVVVLEVARPGPLSVSPPKPAMVLRKKLVYAQSEPILDFVLTEPAAGASPNIQVLDTQKVAIYGKQESNWVLGQSAPLARTHPWPRDRRGRLIVHPDGRFTAYTPGTRCEGTSPPLAMECHDSEDAWPIDLAEPVALSAHFFSKGNYFDGDLTLAGKEIPAPAFFSAAAVPTDPGALTVVTGLDGRARLFDQKPEPQGTLEGLGSDIAAIQSGCGSGWQLVTTHASGMSLPDAVQAFSLRDGTVDQATAPVEFPGPVTALWPDASGHQAVAVARDLATGEYEAFVLSIACGE